MLDRQDAYDTSEKPYTLGFYFASKLHGEEPCDPEAISEMYAASLHDRPGTLRFLTVPDDLRCIARALLLEPYWRQLVERLLNGYESTATSLASGVASEGSDGVDDGDD